EPLVALDALLGVVLGLALLPYDFEPVDPAVALVEEIEVVDEAVGDRDPARRVRAGPVDEQREEDFLGLGGGADRRRQHERGEGRGPDRTHSHDTLLSVNGETATVGASPS